MMGDAVIHQAPAIRDAAGVCAAPGAVAMRDGAVLAAGEPDAVRRAVGAGTPVIDHPERLLLPALVNAHSHLELSAIGPQPYCGDFIEWVMAIRRHCPDPSHPAAPGNAAYFVAAAKRGAALCEAAGVGRVGDVSRFDAVAQAVGRSLGGVGFAELFGVGPPFDQAPLQRMATLPTGAGKLTIGVQPHAPYSAGPRLFAAAAASGRPVMTHLAETPEERRFVARGDGPFLELLKAIGKWDRSFAAGYGRGLTPVQWLAQTAKPRAAWLLAHCNDVTDDDIALIAQRGWSVAYCPRASEYFGHAGHRYRDMLDAGVNVCLGTDSILCTGDLSILHEMRRLHQRDDADPDTLLAMATTRAMRGLGLDENHATFHRGARPGLLAVGYDSGDATDALRQVLGARGTPLIQWIAGV